MSAHECNQSKRVEADGTVSRHGFKIPTSRNIPIIWAYGGDLFDDWADPTVHR